MANILTPKKRERASERGREIDIVYAQSIRILTANIIGYVWIKFIMLILVCLKKKYKN